MGNIIHFRFDDDDISRVKEVREEDGEWRIRIDIDNGIFKGKNRWISLRNCWN